MLFAYFKNHQLVLSGPSFTFFISSCIFSISTAFNSPSISFVIHKAVEEKFIFLFLVLLDDFQEEKGTGDFMESCSN